MSKESGGTGKGKWQLRYFELRDFTLDYYKEKPGARWPLTCSCVSCCVCCSWSYCSCCVYSSCASCSCCSSSCSSWPAPRTPACLPPQGAPAPASAR